MKIQREIFQGDALSTLLFVIAMMPLNHIPRKYTGGWKFSNRKKENQPTNVHGCQQTEKYEKELETLIQAVRTYIDFIGMEIGIGKCVMLVMKSRKRPMTKGIELQNQEKLRTLREKETYKYLGMLKVDTIK